MKIKKKSESGYITHYEVSCKTEQKDDNTTYLKVYSLILTFCCMQQHDMY